MSYPLLPATSRRFVLKTGAAALGAAALGTATLGASRAAENPRQMLKRYSVYSEEGKEALRKYAHAVKIMKDPKYNYPPAPTSWTFQAYIHSCPINGLDDQSPGLTNGSPEFIDRVNSFYGSDPKNPEHKKWREQALACWSTCPHGSPWFLPWHRWYMYYFEQIIQTVLQDSSFALPYWDYASNDGNSLQLPEEFRHSHSPLFECLRGMGFHNPNETKVKQQTQPMNEGGYMAWSQVDYNPSLTAPRYYPADTGSQLHFPPAIEWYDYGYTGRTETQPHDNVHDGVGGLMGNVPTAAQDPIFYAHHCQIDHLWASWQNGAAGQQKINFASPGKGTKNWPDEAQWLQKQFSFVGGDGKLVTVGPQSALDYQKYYSYDKLAPIPPIAGPGLARQEQSVEGGKTKVLLSEAANVAVPAAGAYIELPDTKGKALPANLLLKGVTVQRRPDGPLYVFINLPSVDQADVVGPYFVGPISLFKAGSRIVGTPKTGAHDHDGHGGSTDFTYSILDILVEQQNKKIWTGEKITISILPAGAAPDGDDLPLLTISAVQLLS
ncbi:tyrosinase family protein [Nitrospirillum sp. BR 11828]|uniref:tyrosinase family protein n=1 Tax=Nitrospirillum sp. BR 11828 TaxID=3104325 RepID=UPI002ACAEF14|nr:tyrosinase family protein [Nitrospirillum sp. BR 11828]MDZ5647706.1 tyrosinase family protein [Nitrospirillum sp. BR 11828]